LNIVWFVLSRTIIIKKISIFAVSYLTIVYMISVVTAYYNSHDFIGKAFESLKAQSYECWEWIIVDDGSRPEAVAALNIIIGNEERVRVLTQKNAGQGAARNRGAREAKGDFLCFLDSDDWFDSHKLEKQLAFMRENKSDLSFTGVEGVRLNGCKENFSGISHFDQKRGREFLPGLIKNCLFTLSSVMITKSCFDELGGFSSESEFRGTEDYELWVRAAAADKNFAFIPERLTYYNIRYGSEVRDLIRSYDGTLRAIRPLKNDANPMIQVLVGRRSVYLAGRLIMRAIAADRMEIARYWAGEEPKALFGVSKILMMSGGRPVARLLNIAYRLKKQLQ
jgi:glycosyltransferase involved in cell wall biosynthesis